MSTPTNDGGPAFPWEDTQGTPGLPSPNPGMSLRDYYAAHASEEDIQAILNRGDGWSRQQARFIHADAMLAARNPAPVTKPK